MFRREITELFGNAAADNPAFLTSEERNEQGAENFKRRVFGTWLSVLARYLPIYPLTTKKTPEELAQLLYEARVVSSLREGRELCPSLDYVSLSCPGISQLSFQRVSSPEERVRKGLCSSGKGERYRILVDDEGFH